MGTGFANALCGAGVNPIRVIRHRHGLLRRRVAFRGEFRSFKDMAGRAGDRLPVEWSDRYPCLNDRTTATHFDRHYVYHTAWAARVLAKRRPTAHIDISSHLYFVALVSAFVPIRLYDYRPADVKLPGLETAPADLLALPFEDGSVASLSCMHVVEHVGLGRYGGSLDPDGDLKAIRELKRVLKPGGDLLFVVPVGEPRVRFNAHRIYGYRQIVGQFKDFTLAEFALIRERGSDGLLVGATADMADAERYACGCFWFKRPEAAR
jgi:SAM-dependent methyltransferase